MNNDITVLTENDPEMMIKEMEDAVNTMTFDAEKHIYHIRGIQCSFSSTGLVAQFFPKFDMIKVI